MALCNPYAAVLQEYGHPVQRNTCKQQFHCECVAEAMRMTAGYAGQLKESLQPPLPLSFGAANRGLTGPEKVVLT